MNLYLCQLYIQKLFLFIVAFMLINCSSEPQQNIKIRLVVDEKEKLVLTAYGQEVDILREKYADLINLMDEACNSSHLSNVPYCLFC